MMFALTPKLVFLILAICLLWTPFSAIVRRHANPLRWTAWATLNVVALPAAFLARGLLQLTRHFGTEIGRTLDSIAEEGGVTVPRPHAMWLVVGPQVYGAALLILAGADFVVMALVFQAMGLLSAGRSVLLEWVPLDVALPLVYVLLAGFFGLVLADLKGWTPFAFIWARIEAKWRSILVRVCVTGILLGLLSALAAGLWRYWQLPGNEVDPEWSALLGTMINALLPLLMFLATVLAGKPIGASIQAAKASGLSGLRASAYLLLWIPRLLVELLRLTLFLPTAVVWLTSAAGETAWAWLMRFERVRVKYRLLPMPVLEDLPVIGGDLDEPLWRMKEAGERVVVPARVNGANGKVTHVEHKVLVSVS